MHVISGETLLTTTKVCMVYTSYVCICMYKCMYICMYVYVCICMYIYTYVCYKSVQLTKTLPMYDSFVSYKNCVRVIKFNLKMQG